MQACTGLFLGILIVLFLHEGSGDSVLGRMSLGHLQNELESSRVPRQIVVPPLHGSGRAADLPTSLLSVCRLKFLWAASLSGAALPML